MSPNQPVPETLKRINMRRFLEALREGGTMSRADLTRATNVSAATSSKIISELEEMGLIEELSEVIVTQGRPGRLCRLSQESGWVVGVAVQPHQIEIAISGLDGQVVGDVQRMEQSVPGDSLGRSLAESVRGVTAGRVGTCLGVGVSVPGLVRGKTGVLEYSPMISVNAPLKLESELATHLGTRVALVQENHGLTLAEQYLGDAKHTSNFLLVDVGDGVGMSAVDQGRILFGRDGFTAELGHIVVDPNGAPCVCGNRGCLQTFANDPALRLNAQVGIEALGRALGSAANLYNPSTIFVSGTYFADRSSLQALDRQVRKFVLGPIGKELVVRHTTVTKVLGAIAGIQDAIFSAAGPQLV